VSGDPPKTGGYPELFNHLGTMTMPRPWQHLKSMPNALGTLTAVFAACGMMAIVLTVLPINGWKYEDRPVTYGELWRSGGGVLVVSTGAAMVVLAVGLYRAQGWVRYALPLCLTAMMVYCGVRVNLTAPYEWAGALFWAILSYWYFFWKPAVVAYFRRARGVEPGASPSATPPHR
jgi:hypothetical protein